MTLDLQRVTSRSELSAFRDDWGQLAGESQRPALFQTYEWVVSWLDAFWPDRPLHFAFVRSAGRLAAVAPLVWDERGALRCRQSLAVASNAHSSGSDLLFNGDPAEALEVIMDHARSQTPGRLAFGEVPADSPTIDAVRAMERHGRVRMVWRNGSRAPFVRLRGTWQDYLTSLDSRTRHKLRRNERRLLRDAHGSFETVTRQSDLPRALEEILVIERHSWKEPVGSSIRSEPGAEAFYRGFFERAFRQGWGRIHLLHILGQPAAHVLGVVYRNRYYPLKTSFDARYADLSPGSVLITHALRDSFEHGYDTFEFLGTDEHFKNKLANGYREHVNLCVFAGTLPRCMACRWRENIVKPFVRERMPLLIDLKKKIRTDS